MAYLSGQYSEQDLFVNQTAYNTSTGRQLNGKLLYDFDRGVITAFGTCRAPARPMTPICPRICRDGWAGTALKARVQVYRHTDKGAGNNFITGLSTQGTTSTADALADLVQLGLV